VTFFLSLQLIPTMGLGYEMALLLGLAIALPVVALFLSPRAWANPERDPNPLEPCRTDRDLDAIRLEYILQAVDQETR
jgi:hypothetical protein